MTKCKEKDRTKATFRGEPSEKNPNHKLAAQRWLAAGEMMPFTVLLNTPCCSQHEQTALHTAQRDYPLPTTAISHFLWSAALSTTGFSNDGDSGGSCRACKNAISKMTWWLLGVGEGKLTCCFKKTRCWPLKANMLHIVI